MSVSNTYQWIYIYTEQKYLLQWITIFIETKTIKPLQVITGDSCRSNLWKTKNACIFPDNCCRHSRSSSWRHQPESIYLQVFLIMDHHHQPGCVNGNIIRMVYRLNCIENIVTLHESLPGEAAQTMELMIVGPPRTEISPSAAAAAYFDPHT